MSLLQLVGGVAAAGVVAAGTTAFTATNLTMNASVTPAKLFLGGSLAVSATGTEISNVTFGFADAAHQQLDTVNLAFTDTNSVGGLVTLTTTGSGSQPTWTCTNVSAQASACTAASPSYVDLTAGTLTGLTVTVAPA